MTSAAKMFLGLHNVLISARIARGLTQDQVGTAIGLGRSQFNRVENGHATVNDRQLCAWAAAVGVEIAGKICDE